MKKADSLFKKEIELDDLRVLHNQLKLEQQKLRLEARRTSEKDLAVGRRVSSNESDEELQQLLIRQQNESQHRMDERDKQLRQMGDLFRQAQSEAVAKSQRSQDQLKEIRRRWQQEVKELKEKNGELQDQLRDFEQKLVQPDDEVAEEEGQMSMVQLRQRLTDLEHEHEGLRLQHAHLQADLKSKDAVFQKQRIVLSQEIDSLKEQLAAAKKTTDELDKAMEAQKRANLDTVSLLSRDQQVDPNEARLASEERYERAERELEQMRSEKLQISERVWKLEKELADAKLKLGQKDLEMKSM